MPNRLADVEMKSRTHLADRLTAEGLHRLDVPLSQRVHCGWLRQFELFDHPDGRGSQGT